MAREACASATVRRAAHGAPAGAVFRNAVADGPDGALDVTDMRIRADAQRLLTPGGPRRVWRVAGRLGAMALKRARMGHPNGNASQAGSHRSVFVDTDRDTLVTWQLRTQVVQPLVAGPEQSAGVVVTPEGRLLVASTATSSIDELVGREPVKVIAYPSEAAYLGWDPVRGRLGVAARERARRPLVVSSPPPQAPCATIR